ncbi:MAG TPA: hypothetical protein VJT50_09125 [Pyrinomonadaceae bacterium]|nr:hypothetical protein [Pyrinomonadaceae bacterium]
MKFLMSLGIALFLGATASTAAAQNPAPPSAGTQTEADETFELNIAERHIQEKDFQASTALEIATGHQKDIRVQVGVSVRASSIDVTLRNVTGKVRFRGSLQTILNILRVPTTPREK